MKTIAITGSSGFIGKHLISSLPRERWNIIEIDLDKGIDISNWDMANRIPPFDLVIHLAAKSFVPESFKNPHEFYYVNQISTLNVLELARKYQAKVIFFSSYLYGNPLYLPIDEKHPLTPHNPYAQSKLICEKICEGYNRDFNVPVIIFRPFNIYGPGQNASFLIPGILEQLKSGKIVLKDPRPKRDFIFISDVIRAVLCAIEYDISGLDIYNLGYGKSFSVENVVNTIYELTANKPMVFFTNEIRQGEVLDTVADLSKISSMLGWTPNVDLYQGLLSILSH